MKIRWILAALLALSTPAMALPPVVQPPVPLATPQTPGILSPTPAPRILRTNGVNPSSELVNAIAAAKAGKTVNWCIVGDSTSGYTQTSNGTAIAFGSGTPSGFVVNDGPVYVLQRALEAQNPGVKFQVYDFGIPGTTLAQFEGSGGYPYNVAQQYGMAWWPSADSSNAWYQFVNGAKCNVTFLNWGVNDLNNFNPGQFLAGINDLYFTWPSQDIVILTPSLYNIYTGGTQANAGTSFGALSNASLWRSLARNGASGFTSGVATVGWPHFGIIDVNQWAAMAAGGKDYQDQTMVNDLSAVPSSVTLSTGQWYQFPQTDGDFDLAVTFAGQNSTLGSTSGASITVAVGAMDGGANYGLAPVMANAFSTSNGTGLVANYAYGTYISALKGMSYTAPTDITLEVAVKGDEVTEKINGVVWDTFDIKPNAPFQPAIQFLGQGTVATATMTINKYYVGKARSYNPILSNADMWGCCATTTLTSAGSAIGTNTLTFAQATTNMTVGTGISDTTTPTAIPAGTTISGVSGSGPVTVTISNNIAGVAVSSGDNIAIGTITSLSGGNGINHDASASFNNVYASAINSANLCLVCNFKNTTSVTGITAAGTTLATATALIADTNVVTTVASGTGVSAPNFPPGISAVETVINSGANALNVYPSSSTDQIGTLGVGVPTTVAAGATLRLLRTAATAWVIE